MPAPIMSAPTSRLYDTRPAISHVNLMTDTFIANANIDDLRYISRSLLATGPSGIVPAFLHAAHARLSQTNAKAVPNTQLLFIARSCGAAPTECLHDALSRARKLFGSGMGFASLGILTTIVRATLGLRWDDEGDTADVLATIDGDITQAIQSCKEEVTCGRLNDYLSARNSVNELHSAISECQRDVGSWGGEIPFDRASSSLEFLKIGV